MKYISIGAMAFAIALALCLTSFAAPGDAVLLPVEDGGIEKLYVKQTLAVVGDTLYILRPDEALYSYHIGNEAPVMIMDLKKCNAERTEKIRYIIGGGDKLYAMEAACERLWAFNEAKGVFEPALGLDASIIKKKIDIEPNVSYGLQYDGETDTLYIWLSGEIRGSASFGAWETVAYIPVSGYGGLSCALLPGGYFAADLQDSVRVRNVDPQYLTERLLTTPYG